VFPEDGERLLRDIEVLLEDDRRLTHFVNWITELGGTFRGDLATVQDDQRERFRPQGLQGVLVARSPLYAVARSRQTIV
jgi:hypothetical protein